MLVGSASSTVPASVTLHKRQNSVGDVRRCRRFSWFAGIAHMDDATGCPLQLSAADLIGRELLGSMVLAPSSLSLVAISPPTGPGL